MMPLKIANIGDKVEYMVAEEKKAKKLFGYSGLPEKIPPKIVRYSGEVCYVENKGLETYYKIMPENSQELIKISARAVLRIL